MTTTYCSDNSKNKIEKVPILLADREAPMGWVYLKIYEDSTFQFTLTGLRKNLAKDYSGKVIIRGDSLFFTYTDSVPRAGKTAIFNDKTVAYIDGKYPERVEIKKIPSHFRTTHK